MKKVQLYIILLAILFAFSFFTNESNAQGKWEIKSVTCPTSCKLNAKDLTFKVKIKNISNAISNGDKLTVKVIITFDGNNLGGNELDFGQSSVGNIGIGKTTNLNVLCTNENLRQFTNTKGTKDLSVTIQLLNENTPSVVKNFKMKVNQGIEH